MNTYRISKEAVKSSSLTATTILGSVPCDRNAVLESVQISSRAGITADAVNFSTIKIKNGSDVLFQRAFSSDDLSALTPESLSPLKDSTVSSSTCLEIEYTGDGTGLAVDCDLVLVFRLARP